MIRLGLVGWPVAHSLSPKLQTAALQLFGLKGEYLLYALEPNTVGFPDALPGLLNQLRIGYLQGLNVTIPYKQVVIPLLDELTEVASTIGAVNVIYMRAGRLIGDNTDAPGFLADLYRNFGVVKGKVLVLGAGGSARAVTWALANSGLPVLVAARDAKQARFLSESISREAGGLVESVALETDALRASLAGVGLIVNSTPLGMSPAVELSPWADGLLFPEGADVYDLVYNPRETRLVRQARASGLRAASGLGMLVEQAALGFEIWTGRVPPRDLMFMAVEA